MLDRDINPDNRAPDGYDLIYHGNPDLEAVADAIDEHLHGYEYRRVMELLAEIAEERYDDQKNAPAFSRIADLEQQRRIA